MIDNDTNLHKRPNDTDINTYRSPFFVRLTFYSLAVLGVFKADKSAND